MHIINDDWEVSVYYKYAEWRTPPGALVRRAAKMAQPSEFTLKTTPVENLRPLKVRVIGAGFSGIYLGIRIPQRLRNVDLVIYEKNEGVGGTWWENRYPGSY